MKIARNPKNKTGGFTLIEMVATLAIIAIFSLSIALLAQPMISIYLRSVSLSQSEIISSSVGELMRDQLSYATSVTLTDPQSDGSFASAQYINPRYGQMIISNKENIVSVADSGAEYGFNKNFYMNKKATVRFRRDSASTLCSVITIEDQNGQSFTTSLEIGLLNCEI